MSKKTEATAQPAAQEAAADAPVVVTVPFDGVPDGLVYPRAFAVGDTVEGALAEVALVEGWGERRPV